MHSIVVLVDTVTGRSLETFPGGSIMLMPELRPQKMELDRTGFSWITVIFEGDVLALLVHVVPVNFPDRSRTQD